jgi:hypothetical protein
VNQGKFQVLAGAAALVAVVGLVMSVATVRATPQAMAKLERRAADYAKLQSLATDLDRAKAVLRARAAMGQDRAVPVQDLLMSAFPGTTPQIQPRETRALDDGWSARSVEVVLDDADLAGIGRLATDAASAQPSWRIAECAITASDRAGHGRITLLLEAIERSSQSG